MIQGYKPEGTDHQFHRTCNVCNSRLTSRFSNVRDPITNESFAILACTKCGLGHTVPQPAEMLSYYGKQYYGKRHGITSRFFLKRSLNMLARTRNAISGGCLLDIGCGDGSFLLAAKEAGWKVTGTELNPHPARALGLDVRQTLNHMDRMERFDCITMWHSLEHMRDIKATLSLIAGRLNPQGRLIIAVPDNSSLQASVFGPGWLHLDVPRHLYHFDPDSLQFSLENTGFRVCHFRHHEMEYNLIGWSQSAMNYLPPKPNVFLDLLTGKGKDHSTWNKILNLILGSILTSASAIMLPVEALTGRSGTFVMVACRKA